MTTTQVVGKLIAGFYPEGWRRNFGEDLEEFITVRGLRPRDLVGLAAGVVDAHVQARKDMEWRPAFHRQNSRALTLCVLALCLLTVSAASVTKASEDGAIGAFVQSDRAVQLSLAVLSIATLLGVISAAAAWIPALTVVVRTLARNRDAIGLSGLLLPLAVCGGGAGELAILIHHLPGRTEAVVAILVASAVLSCALTLWGLRLAIRRAGSTPLPAWPAQAGGTAVAALGVVALLAEGVWFTRVATSVPHWSTVPGVISMPMTLTMAASTIAALMAVGFALRSAGQFRRESLP